ncbi:unnamed protein product, partial [Mesorhabditis belari]|uniref:Beta-N-acetylhexosaminidase n=1 Tax=Mesorhabditis belari TaxID=2138241 RepID=A0AAF3FTI7_9BILA
MVWLLRQFRRRGISAMCKMFGVALVIITLLQITSSAPQRDELNKKPLQFSDSVKRKENQRILPENNQKEEDFDDARQPQQPLQPQEQQPRKPPAVNQNAPNDFGGQNLGALEDILHKKVPTGENNRKGQFYEQIFVHFDLKGAPPKVPYFLQLLELVQKAGATGVMIEWEDMFPYTGRLQTAVNTDAYSMDDVHAILSKAHSLGLIIVPLVQTFAHLEWILKLEEFRKYRTVDEFPQVLCLADKEGVDLVKDTLDQVIAVHKQYGIPYFHIGCDEAFLFGACKEDLEWMKQKGPDGSKELLALLHMKDIANYVKGKVGQETTVLVWHDMLKNFPPQIIQKAEVKDLIEPVVWDYSEGIVTMNEWSFQTLADSFPAVWASSAYKGANFPSAKYIDIRHYEMNNRAWIEIVKSNKQRFKRGFKGIIITGWQRYDHMAGLCEILPMGTPSMILQIETALSAPNKEDQAGIRRRAGHKLNCTGDNYYVAGLEPINTQCNFTGFGAYYAFQNGVRKAITYMESEMDKHHPTIGWLNDYARKHDMTQNWYLRDITQFVQMQLGQLQQAERQLRNQLNPLFFENTVEEFVFETIGPHIDKLTKMVADAERLRKLRVWPKRHFPIKKDEL